MSLSTFSFPTTILFGAGAIDQLPNELAKRGVLRPLLVTDAGLERSSVFERVSKLIPGATVYSGVAANPTERNVLDGEARYRESKCDGIVGLGGGSPLDAAKAIRLKITHEAPLAEYDDLLDGANRISANLPPYIAIATTSGTGSEVSRSAVVTIQATNRKTVIFSPYLIPSLALSDPELTVEMPPHITSGTGMDAFTHNVEAYLSKGYHPVCDAVALAGAKLVWENLPRVMEAPGDLEARSNMMMASMMGAIAFQKGPGRGAFAGSSIVVRLRHASRDVERRAAPVVLEFNRPVVAGRMADLAALMGGGDLAERVRELNRRLGIAPRLRDWKVTEEILPKLADKAIQDGCHQLNPRPCSREDLLALYRAAY